MPQFVTGWQRSGKCLIDDLLAQRAIAFELAFGEELFRRALVGKVIMLGPIGQHVG